MPLDTLCYSCKTSVQIYPGVVSTCPTCDATFIALPGFAPICGCDFCSGLTVSAGVLMYGPHLLDDSREILVARGVTFLDPNDAFPAFCDLTVTRSNGLGGCRFACSWGADYYHLDAWPSESKNDFYLIYPVRHHSPVVPLYHGTKPSLAKAILEEAELKPPSRTGQKSNGFVTEQDLRYVGIDKRPAEDHSSGAILEISYTGWVLVTHLGLSTPPIHKLNKVLPPNIPAIEFWESGLCIAFRSDAVVTPTKNAYNETLLVTLTPPVSKAIMAYRWTCDFIKNLYRNDAPK